MSGRIRKPCAEPGCGRLVQGANRCGEHTRAARRAVDDRRGTAAHRGYGEKWRKARETYLIANPLCTECGKENRLEPATVVDHIKPHGLGAARDSGNLVAIAAAQRLFWDRANWQSLCKTHHDRKTATEDGAFGARMGRGGVKT